MTKSRSKKIGMMLAALVFACVTAEIGARIYLGWIADDAMFLKYASADQLHARLGAPRFQTHRHLGYCLTPGYRHPGDTHNSLGFRGDEITTDKPAGTLRIICTGGSTTYGWGVRHDYRSSYPTLLQTRLRQTGLRAEVINAGTPGWTTLEVLIDFQSRLLDLAPDYLFVYLGINDVMPRLVWPHVAYRGDLSGWLTRSEHIRQVSWLQSSSICRILMVKLGYVLPHSSLDRIIGTRPPSCRYFDFVAQRKSGRYPAGIFDEVPVGKMLEANTPKYFERNLRSLVSIAEAHGVRVVLSTFVVASGFPLAAFCGHPAIRQAVRETNEIVRAIAADTSAELFDMAKLFPDDDSLFTDGIHFTAKGNAERVRLILTEVLERRLGR